MFLCQKLRILKSKKLYSDLVSVAKEITALSLFFIDKEEMIPAPFV